MKDIITIIVALLGGFAVLAWVAAWFTVLPFIGLLWLVGWLA